MNRRRRSDARLRAAVLVLPALLYPSRAEAVDSQYQGPDLGNWNVDANWSTGFVPDAAFDEVGAINNHANVFVNSAIPMQAGGVKLGQAAGQSGGLRIQHTGVLRCVATQTETGAIIVGGAGHGGLTIHGGTLTGRSLSLGGAAGSAVTLADSARLLISPGAADLQRITTIIGPGMDFSAAGGLTLGGTSTLIGDIRNSALHSPIKTAGAATLGGTFRPIFTGVTPMLGNTWSIIDAASIAGSFTLDTSGAPALPPGQGYALIQSSGGVNGRLLQLTVATQLVTATWSVNASGNWSLGGNWADGVTPHGVGHTANFGSVIDAPRTITVDVPRTVGSINFDNPVSYTIAGPGAITMDALTGSAAVINVALGNHTIAAPITLNDDTTVNISAASSTVALTGAVTATGRTITKTGAGTARFANIRAAALNVTAGRAQIIPNGGPDGTSRVSTLNVSIGGRLDLTDNDLVIDYTSPTPIATARSLIRSAYNNGDWAGDGLTTSMGDASQFGLGYAESGALFTTFPATFSGQQVDDTSVLIGFTRYGDANLDGAVNLADFNRLAANFGSATGVWTQGDFTYDARVNLEDFNRLAANFGLSAAGSEVTPEDWAALASAVPEPHAVLGASLGIAALRRVRRAS
jgi:hypothetical protein